MVHDGVMVVRGKQLVRVDGEVIRREASRFDRVVVDMGTGDGRWIYRLARQHPSWCCIGLDANARQMRDASFRAGRKPERGGTANAWFLRAGVEGLPGPLGRLADEIHIQFPWGTLLRATLTPDPSVLMRIAQIGRPGATLTVQINAGVFDDRRASVGQTFPRHAQDMTSRLSEGYSAAGIHVAGASLSDDSPQTSWSRRLNGGRPQPVLTLNGIIVGSESTRPQR